jgi:hypothetical protein
VEIALEHLLPARGGRSADDEANATGCSGAGLMSSRDIGRCSLLVPLAPIRSHTYLEELKWRRKVFFEVRGVAAKEILRPRMQPPGVQASCHVLADSAPF